MSTAEQNAMLVAFSRFLEKMPARQLAQEIVAERIKPGVIEAAFRAGWRAANAYDEEEGGPG